MSSTLSHRLAMFPITDPAMWQSYKKAQKFFWVDEEIDNDLSKDKVDWEQLSPDIQKYLKHILAFFAVSDGIVNDSLTDEIVRDIDSREIKCWYNYQIMMEDVHNTVYSKLIEAYISDPEERKRLLDSAIHFPSVGKKIDWYRKHIRGNNFHQLSQEELTQIRSLITLSKGLCKLHEVCNNGCACHSSSWLVELERKLDAPKPTLAHKLFINAIMEGLFFSGNFAGIFWINSHLHKMPALHKANDFISRDEGMHAEIGCLLYRHYTNEKDRFSEQEAHTIMVEAKSIATNFACEALPRGLLGMNSALMTQYIEFVADQLLTNLGYHKLYNTENPFDFMINQSMGVRMGDFFIYTPAEYGHHASGTTSSDQKLSFNEDF